MSWTPLLADCDESGSHRPLSVLMKSCSEFVPLGLPIAAALLLVTLPVRTV
jgi:hypothetical protein